MGRPRTKDHDLPRNVYLRHGAYYKVVSGKWRNLGRDRTIAVQRASSDYRGRKTPRPRGSGAKVSQSGFLYVIGFSNRSAPVKIGVAADVAARLVSLQTSNHERLEIKGCIRFPPGAAHRAERRAHKWLNDYRLAGEWFNFSFDGPGVWIELLRNLDVAPVVGQQKT